MSEEIVLKEVEVTKLNLKPSDFLVFTVPDESNHYYLSRLTATIRNAFPRIQAVIMSNKVKISVITKEEAESIPDAPTEVADEHEA